LPDDAHRLGELADALQERGIDRVRSARVAATADVVERCAAATAPPPPMPPIIIIIIICIIGSPPPLLLSRLIARSD
jgi:hypothetical protein